MSWTKATWKNGNRTITGEWIYQWSSRRFHITLDSVDGITGQNRKITTCGDSPEWGKWRLTKEHDDMRTLKFYGASDDLFEIEGTTGDEPDEVGCYDSPAVAKVESPTEGALAIVANYTPAGATPCWSIGLMPVDEGVEMPNWVMSWSTRDYSAELTMIVPDDAVVSMMCD